MSAEERSPLVYMHAHQSSGDGSEWDWSMAAANRPAAATVLHPGVLHSTLQYLPPTSICAVSRVSRSFAHASRSDALWELVLQRDWFDDMGIEGAELQRRVRREARARRGLHDIDEMEDMDAQHAATLAHVPVLTAQALEGAPPSAPQSPEQQACVDAASACRVTPPQRKNESGIPRARSIAALNALMMPSPTGNAGGIGRAGLGLSPRPSAPSTPSVAQRQLSPDSESSSDTISPPPLRRTVSDSALISASSLPFSFPTPAQVAAAFSPRPAPRSEVLAAQRWLAPPASLKAVYSDVVHASYARFQVEHHMAVAERLPRPVKFAVVAGIAVALLAFLAIHVRGSPPAAGDTAALEQWQQSLRTLSLLYTSSLTLVLLSLCINVCRVLHRSLEARRVLWREPPLLSPEASDAELEAAAADAAFQATDQAWWRHRFSNRWYYVRYQVWTPARLRWLLVLLVGVGAFVLLWGGVTVTLGAWWPAAGGLLGISFPGLTLLLSFQLARMLHVSRATHVVIAVLLSVLQLACLLFLLHAGCSCLVWLLNQSAPRAVGSMVASFTPNLLLCLFIFWSADEYILFGWAPVTLPPRVAAFHQDELQLAEQGGYPRAPLQLTIEQERDAEGGGGGGSGGGGGGGDGVSFSEGGADAWSPHRYIPAPHTLGRLLFGSELERSHIESRLSRPMRSRLFSHGCVCALAGVAAYAVTHTYWTHLFGLFAQSNASFSLLALSTRCFHVASLVQCLVASVGASVLAVLVRLQNRDWRWWWAGAHVCAAQMAAVCTHYVVWVVGQESAMRLQAAAEGPLDAYAPLLDSSEQLHAFHSQIASHFLFSWSTPALSLCASTCASLGATLVALLLLYRPKSVRAMINDAAKAEEAAVAAAHAHTHVHAAARDEFQQAERLPAHLSPHLYPYPVMTEAQPSASPPVDSLAYSYRVPTYLAPAQSSPLSFLQSLHQPNSPAIDLHDPALYAQPYDQRNERLLQYPRVSAQHD